MYAMPEMTPEQQKALQERLKNMSPEELREFYKQQCVFCQIIAGKVPARKIYEDEKLLAVLDINPAAPGHLLVMPKEHYQVMPQLPDDELQYFFMVTKQLSALLLRALQVEGTTLFIANGAAAGQRAQHFMAHVIPRLENDGVGIQVPKGTISQPELQHVIAQLGGAPPGKKPIESKEGNSESADAPDLDDISKLLGK